MLAIYLDIDTLRPDRLGCYGSTVPTPNVDALCADGVRFDAAYAANTPCMPSRASVFTGCFGAVNGVVTHGPSALQVRTPAAEALPRVLAEAGVETVTVSSFGRHPAPWFYNGFCQVNDPSYRCGAQNFQRFAGSEVNRMALDHLRCYKGGDAFLHLHYWDPHSPLAPPQEYIDPAALPDTSHVSDAQLAELAASPLYRGGRHMKIRTRQDLAELLRLYEAEVRYTDALIGEILSELKVLGLYQDCCILLSADHGEQYGEAGMILEHGTVHQSCIHIPLLCKLPGLAHKGKACAAPVYGLDLAPTLAHLFGISAPGGWHGVPLQAIIEETVPPRGYLVCEHGLYTCQRAVLQGSWKLVHTYHPGVWEIPKYQLFDLAADPHEQQDVNALYPHHTARLAALEQTWLSQTLHGTPDPLALLARQGGPYGLAVAQTHY